MKKRILLWLAGGVLAVAVLFGGAQRVYRALPDEYKTGGDYRVFRSEEPPFFSMIYPEGWRISVKKNCCVFASNDREEVACFIVRLLESERLHENYLDQMIGRLDEDLCRNDSVCERGAFEHDGLLGLYYIHEFDLMNSPVKSAEYLLPYGDSAVVHIEFFTPRARFDESVVQARKMLSSFHLAR